MWESEVEREREAEEGEKASEGREGRGWLSGRGGGENGKMGGGKVMAGEGIWGGFRHQQHPQQHELRLSQFICVMLRLLACSAAPAF